MVLLLPRPYLTSYVTSADRLRKNSTTVTFKHGPWSRNRSPDAIARPTSTVMQRSLLLSEPGSTSQILFRSFQASIYYAVQVPLTRPIQIGRHIHRQFGQPKRFSRDLHKSIA